MKFCYADESGLGEEHIFVMAGIVTDAARMHMTKKEWNSILDALSGMLKKPVKEFHTRHFYRGHGIWHDLTGDQRKRLMDIILKWIKERRHLIVFTAIDKKKANRHDFTDKPEYIKGGKVNYWRLAALHLMLCIQKEFQKYPATKGHTVIVFDHESAEENYTGETALDAPCWTDTYYGYNRKSRKQNKPEPLSHIIDVPYFADSKHVGMLHIADLFAYLIRHYAELKVGSEKPQYAGETEVVSSWVKEISQFMLPDSNRWPARSACECAKFFKTVAPEVILRIKDELQDNSKILVTG